MDMSGIKAGRQGDLTDVVLALEGIERKMDEHHTELYAKLDNKLDEVIHLLGTIANQLDD